MATIEIKKTVETLDIVFDSETNDTYTLELNFAARNLAQFRNKLEPIAAGIDTAGDTEEQAQETAAAIMAALEPITDAKQLKELLKRLGGGKQIEPKDAAPALIAVFVEVAALSVKYMKQAEDRASLKYLSGLQA